MTLLCFPSEKGRRHTRSRTGKHTTGIFRVLRVLECFRFRLGVGFRVIRFRVQDFYVLTYTQNPEPYTLNPKLLNPKTRRIQLLTRGG
jgi:hypothetical protein